MSIQENILNQVADANKSLEAIQGLSSVSVDKLNDIKGVIKNKKDIVVDFKETNDLLKELIKKDQEPIKLNVKLNIK